MRWRESVYVAAREFFQVSLVTYLLLTLAETLKAGFVSNFFNLNYLLIVVLVTGVAMVVTQRDEPAAEAFAKPQSAPVRARTERAKPLAPRRRIIR